jgi:2-dehydro-3-deoxy-L-rhamnonate dehydrogenase (NAD+)
VNAISARYDFAGRVVIVTGGAGDLGRAAATRLAADGAAVALLDVAEEPLRSFAGELEAKGVAVLAVPCDVTDRNAVAGSLAAVVERFGRVDGLFNNAGYQGAFAPTDAYPTDDFERVLSVNVTGAFIVLRAVAAQMRAAGGGAIVNTASHAGVKGPPNMIAYAASKFAVVGMTQTAARDLAPHGVRVNAVSPALIGPGTMWERQTRLQAATGTRYFDADPAEAGRRMIGTVAMNRLGTPDEVANVVAYLLSDESSYVTGFNVEVTGGI